MSKNKEVLERVDKEIKKLDDKSFSIFFFIIDSKGTPSGSMSYIYEMALTLKKLGYDVKMLHQEKEFIGVGEWLGEEYAEIPHVNIDEGNLAVSTSDFLFIPEVFPSIMQHTKKLPCKRIGLMQNFNYLTEFTPFSATWANYGIQDAVCSSDMEANMLKGVFPFVKSKTISPKIAPYFRNGIEPKKLIINVVTKDQSYVNRIVKPFYWKYPIFKWVTFRDLRGFPREQYADMLREGFATVWIDNDAQFGYSPLEAMRSGNIVIGKIPELIPEWMLTGDGKSLRNNGIWFDDMRDIHKIIYSVVRSWINNDVPTELLKEMEETNKLYSHTVYEENVKEMMESYISNRKKEFEDFKSEVLEKVEEK